MPKKEKDREMNDFLNKLADAQKKAEELQNKQKSQ